MGLFADILEKRALELTWLLVAAAAIGGSIIGTQAALEQSREKEFISDIKRWIDATDKIYERRGRYPGDMVDKNGIIGDDPRADVKSDMEDIIAADVPKHVLNYGASKFYVFLGNNGKSDKLENILVVCKTSSCEGLFNDREIAYLKALDKDIDGTEDGSFGRVLSAASAAVDTERWIVRAADITGGWDTSTTRAMVFLIIRSANMSQ